MFRFTIRDVLWLTVVVAMSVVLWLDRRSIQTERSSLEQQRASFEKQRASQRTSLEKEWAFLHQATVRSNPNWNYELRNERARFVAEQVPEAEREQAKRRSIELGAPKVAPLPPGYGETPNAP